jgi:hypothetical protein
LFSAAIEGCLIHPGNRWGFVMMFLNLYPNRIKVVLIGMYPLMPRG